MKTLYNNESTLLDISKSKGQNLRLNENICSTDVCFNKRTSGRFDFRDEKNLFVCGDVSNAKLLFNRKANFLSLSVKGLHGKFDFSNVRILYLDHSDLSNTKIKFNPNARFIDIYQTKGLRGYLDFSNVQELKLGEDDEQVCSCIKNVSGIKFNPNGLVIGISEEKKCLLEFAYSRYEKTK